MSDIKRIPRWPLFLIAAPAAVAVWSGWVSLGQLCGFGVVHPLPGIADGFTLNTAITLPVGVEAYGGYALRAWLTPGTSARARVFAKWSAIGALILGMAGQAVYHLLAAAHATRAPWPVTMLVACLPVVTLGFGTALAHLLHEAGEEIPEGVPTPACMAVTETVAAVPADVPATVRSNRAGGVPGIESENVPGNVIPTASPERARTVAPGRAPVRASSKRKMPTPERAEKAFAADLAEGRVPSLRQVKTRMRVGTEKARHLRDHLEQVCVQAGNEAVAA